MKKRGKIQKTIALSPELARNIEDMAEEENRSFSNMAERILERACQQIEDGHDRREPTEAVAGDAKR